MNFFLLLGEQDVYTHVTLIKKWDICAPNAILNALGGQLTTLTGDAIDYSGKLLLLESSLIELFKDLLKPT